MTGTERAPADIERQPQLVEIACRKAERVPGRGGDLDAGGSADVDQPVETDTAPFLLRVLQDLDAGLRATLGADPRPYEVTYATEGHVLGYSGPVLTAAQRAEALAFLDWIRHRDL